MAIADPANPKNNTERRAAAMIGADIESRDDPVVQSDTGPDFRMQMIDAGGQPRIDAVVYTPIPMPTTSTASTICAALPLYQRSLIDVYGRPARPMTTAASTPSTTASRRRPAAPIRRSWSRTSSPMRRHL